MEACYFFNSSLAFFNKIHLLHHIGVWKYGEYVNSVNLHYAYIFPSLLLNSVGSVKSGY